MKVLKRKKFDAAMSRLLLAIVASMATISAGAASPEQARLLVGIMVDGLDADQLDLLREHFSQGGFRLLEEKGVSLTADYGTPLDATAATAQHHRLPVSAATPNSTAAPCERARHTPTPRY